VSFVLGREASRDAGIDGRIGHYRALDGSEGAPLFLDLDGPHAMLIVGKRGYGKSFTLGVVAEELARSDGVAPVLIDPMGVFETLATTANDVPVPATVIDEPTVTPDSLDPRSWCSVLGLSPMSGAGGLVWRAATESETIAEMQSQIGAAEASKADRRAAINHLEMAAGWDVLDADGLDATALAGGEVTVVDIRGKSIKLGFTFPADASVLRREIHERIQEENRAASSGAEAFAAAFGQSGDAADPEPKGDGSDKPE